MATKLLLLKDVFPLGRKGEVKSVRPGYARNFLIPQGFAAPATVQTLRLQEKLKVEREKQSLLEKQESEEIAARLAGVSLTTIVKVDHDGRMYGSVNQAEIVHLLLKETQIDLDKRMIQLKHALKSTGSHIIQVKLKEGVIASFELKIMSEEEHRASLQENATPAV